MTRFAARGSISQRTQRARVRSGAADGQIRRRCDRSSNRETRRKDACAGGESVITCLFLLRWPILGIAPDSTLRVTDHPLSDHSDATVFIGAAWSRLLPGVAVCRSASRLASRPPRPWSHSQPVRVERGEVDLIDESVFEAQCDMQIAVRSHERTECSRQVGWM